MNVNIKIFAQLSKFNVWNQHNKQIEQMYNGIEELVNILSYVDFEKLYHVINYFPELNEEIEKKDIIVPLSSSSRAIKWGKKFLHEFESSVDQIDTRTYHDLTIGKNYFKKYSIYNTGNKMIMTCFDLSKRQ